MFELGIRLTLSQNPTILIRQEHKPMQRVFDIGDLYCFPYNLNELTKLDEHLLKKIKEYDQNPEDYYSPIIKRLENHPDIIRQISRNRALLRLKMLHFLMLGYHSKLNVAITNFIKEHEDEEIPERSGPFLAYLKKHCNNLQKLNWDEFNFKSKAVPPLEAFLEEPCVNRILPYSAENLFTFYVCSLYDLIIDNDETWNFLDFDLLIQILDELFIFHKFLKSVVSGKNMEIGVRTLWYSGLFLPGPLCQYK